MTKKKQTQRDAYHEAPNNPDWPPFPLPDIYNNDDPELICAAIYAIGRLLRNYNSESPFFGKQLKAAIGVARDIRSAYPELENIPLAKNLIWPVERDFIELEQWFLNASTFVRAEEAKEMARVKTAQGKPDPPTDPPEWSRIMQKIVIVTALGLTSVTKLNNLVDQEVYEIRPASKSREDWQIRIDKLPEYQQKKLR